MEKKIMLLNDLYLEIDLDLNGEFYDQETLDTGVIYRIENIMEQKSYVGRADSYKNHGTAEDPIFSRYGAKGRFKVHWRRANHEDLSYKQRNACPIFYEAIRNSDINDWFIYVLKICPLDDLQYWETEMTKLYQTSDPKYGYNYFVGNNKPDNENHLLQYQNAKAKSNTERAIDGKMKRVDHNKNLPTYISYYPVTENGNFREGYMARIKFDGKIYKKIFTSMEQTMEEKLEHAKKYIEIIKNEHVDNKLNKINNNINTIISKGATRTEHNKNLPKNICYTQVKRKGKIFGEGYRVSVRINKKRYSKLFASMDFTMKEKLEKAKKQLELFKKQASEKKYSGSKTAKKQASNKKNSGSKSAKKK